MIAISDVRTPHHLSAEQYYRLTKNPSGFDGSFASLSGKPTTLAGYGITDAQPLDSDLTAIAALSTTSFGRGFLTQADAAASRSYIGAGSSSFSGAFADLTGKPTTIGGYGITDFNSLGDARWSLLAHTHTFASLTSKPTTLSGYGITDAQGLDATLTALAALTIAADSLTIGTGSDAFSQTSFAANTFPAKSSTGNLVAKTITDFGLSLIDDAAASNARTTLGLVIGTDVQAYDADLTSLAGATGTHDIYFRSAANTWTPVLMGPGVYLKGSTLTTMRTEISSTLVANDTKASASTLDLTGLNGPVIDVTGTTNISSITLADGETRMLRFTGAGLTLAQGSLLQLLGGVNLTVTTNGIAVLTGGAGGLVTLTDYKNVANYSTETFDNIYMKANANIGFDPDATFFAIGRSTANPTLGNYLRVMDGLSGIGINDRNTDNGVEFKTDLLTDIRSQHFPDRNGTYALQDGIALKLGDLTTNGLVTTSGSDGTLGVTVPATGVMTFLATPNSANLRAAMTDESGSGALLFASGALGTPASGVFTNCTGLPITTGLANMATASVIYRRTAGSGAPEVNTLATLKTDLGVASGDAAAEAAANSYTDSAIAAITLPASGTYTPGVSGDVNTGLGGVTMQVASYMRVGDMVIVSGQFSISPALPATDTRFDIDLPVATATTDASTLSGTAGLISGTVTNASGVTGSGAGLARFEWKSTSLGGEYWSYMFSYQITAF